MGAEGCGGRGSGVGAGGDGENQASAGELLRHAAEARAETSWYEPLSEL